MYPQEKYYVTWYWNLWFTISTIYRYAQHTTRHIICALLFLAPGASYVPDTFFTTKQQVKAIEIGISEVNPLAKLMIVPS